MKERISVMVSYSCDYYHEGFGVASSLITQPCCMDRGTVCEAMALIKAATGVQPRLLFQNGEAKKAWGRKR